MGNELIPKPHLRVEVNEGTKSGRWPFGITREFTVFVRRPDGHEDTLELNNNHFKSGKDALEAAQRKLGIPEPTIRDRLVNVRQALQRLIHR